MDNISGAMTPRRGVGMTGFRVVGRDAPLPLGWKSFAILLTALAFAFFVCSMLLLVQGKSPWTALVLLLQGGFGGRYPLEDTLLKAIPLFLCSAGVSIAFRMKVWNIGAEGQFALGGVGATAAVLLLPPDAPAWIMLPSMMLGAALSGGLWGFLPGLLKLRFGLNEIISTLMLNYIGIELMRYLVYGPWKAPSSMGFPMTAMFPASAIFPSLFGRTHAGLLLCVVTALALAAFLSRTRLGFELRAAGENPRNARYARIPYGFLLLFVLTLSGALAGLVGCVEVSSTFNRLQPNLCTGYGYTAIVVAWLSRLRISSIAFFSFFLAGLKVGVENLQIELQVPAAFGGILEGFILLCVLAGQFFHHYRLVRAGAQQEGETA